jgi:quinol monooxygenase YgiN
MVTMFWSYRVRDWESWSTALEQLTNNAVARERREKYGMVRRSVYRSVDDPNEVMMVAEFRSREGAEALLRDEDGLRAWHERTGLEMFPPVLITEEFSDGRYLGSGTSI